MPILAGAAFEYLLNPGSMINSFYPVMIQDMPIPGISDYPLSPILSLVPWIVNLSLSQPYDVGPIYAHSSLNKKDDSLSPDLILVCSSHDTFTY